MHIFHISYFCCTPRWRGGRERCQGAGEERCAGRLRKGGGGATGVAGRQNEPQNHSVVGCVPSHTMLSAQCSSTLELSVEIYCGKMHT